MSAARNLNSFFNINIRNERYSFDSIKSLKLQIVNQEVQIINFSDSGVSFRCDRDLDLKQSEPISIFNKNTLLLTLEAQFVRKSKDLAGHVWAYTFANENLSENFVENLKLINEVAENIEQKTIDQRGLSREFVVECFLLFDYLKDFKRSCEEFEAKINIQSLEAKMNAVELALTILGAPAVEKIKFHAHKLDLILAGENSKDIRLKHANFFRSHLGQYFIGAAFTGRAWLKPRGYAGDYEMMNQIYRQSAEGVGLFEKIIHLYGINESSSQSVVLRKNYLKKKIANLIDQAKKGEEITIGSLACGPAREVLETLLDSNEVLPANLRFVLMDQDHHALLNAKRNITKALRSKGHLCEVSFLPLSVKQILEATEEAEVLNFVNFNLLYTAGLYDYLTQTVARNLTSIISRSIKVGGQLIIGNFHPDNPTKTISDLICDWRLIHRNHDQMKDLISTSEFKNHDFYLDEIGIDLFIEANK